ncbi:MAG: recombinase family protein, partial [Cytophagales bacterium]|nr:recombinase family protein [Cytophagales bacterium]
MKNTDNLEIFEANFGKKNLTKRKIQNNLCVIYTRVSSKDQEDNTSLESQRRYCEDYAERKKLLVVEYFGGTHESAKTDERKELKRMLQFVKRKKISNILVFKVDRFSRSGAGGISLAEELRQGGHAIHSVTEPGDSFT